MFRRLKWQKWSVNWVFHEFNSTNYLSRLQVLCDSFLSIYDRKFNLNVEIKIVQNNTRRSHYHILLPFCSKHFALSRSLAIWYVVQQYWLLTYWQYLFDFEQIHGKKIVVKSFDFLKIFDNIKAKFRISQITDAVSRFCAWMHFVNQ